MALQEIARQQHEQLVGLVALALLVYHAHAVAVAVDQSGVSAEFIAKEREIFIAQSIESGKPEAIAQKMVDALVTRVKEKGVECSGVVVVGDHPYEEIIKSAEARKCDLIMMASHGRRGVSALLLGSETQKVLTHTKLPVIVVR